MSDMKFCKHCGEKIHIEAVICTICGRQVEELKGNNNVQQTVIVNNTAVGYGRPKNKWVSLLLCFFLGWLGAHRFYEGKVGTGVLYLLTTGLCGIGVVVDFIILLFKPEIYYD